LGYAADRIACFKMGTDAGSEGALAALVERAGATLVPTFEEFTAAVSGFATNRLPRGNRIAVIANGSGFASLTASAAQACGIDLHGLSNATIKDLKTAYPSQQIAVNPVNVGATASPERYRKTLQIVLQDPMIDGALVVVAPSPVTTIDPTLKLLAKTAAGSYKPVITAWVSDRIALSVRKQLRSVPNAPISAIQSPVAAALAFGYLAAEARRRADRLSIPPEWSVELNPAKLAEARAIVNGARLEGRHALSPSETGRLLACFEIPVVPLREVGTLEEAGKCGSAF
jgi:acetyltransferase